MLSFRRPARGALLSLLIAGWIAGWNQRAEAQPALTTIEDILYRADGTRYTGTIFITWNSFQAGDTSNIATANLTFAIINGVLQVRLVPTTTASAGAQYNVTYNNNGLNQFTEIWAVPPTSVTLRVRDVRVSSGTVVGPPPVTSPVQIPDVVGLTNELTVRPVEGVGFQIGRAAVINQSGQIDGATGNLTDCVRVDGSSGPCGSGGGGISPAFADSEAPAGAINSSNRVYTLAFAPSPASSLELYRNGLLQQQNLDYTLSGSTLTFGIAETPQTGDLLAASYRYGNPSNPLGSLTSSQVICSSNGSSTNSTAPTQLASCTAQAGLLTAGDRIEIQYAYSHTGSATGITPSIQWGGTTVLSRTSTAGESNLVGRLTFGITASTQIWSSESWGASTSVVNSAGSTSANTSQNLVISFRGQMASATSDTINLSNFTVIRYPAQTNP
jgi:hypothetical protein